MESKDLMTFRVLIASTKFMNTYEGNSVNFVFYKPIACVLFQM